MTKEQEKVIKKIEERKGLFFYTLKAVSTTKLFEDENDIEIVFYRVRDNGIKRPYPIIVGMSEDGDIYRVETRESNPYMLKDIIKTLLGEEE